MPRFWLALLIGCVPAIAVSAEPRKVDVVRVDSEQAKSVEIVSQKMSADGKVLWVELKPNGKRFSVDFDLTGHTFDRVKITIRRMKKLDIARYQTDYRRAKASINLHDSPGVRIEPDGEDTVIDFMLPRAARILGPEGRLLVKEATDQGEKPAP